MLCGVEHVQNGVGLVRRHPRDRHGKRLVGIDVEIDGGHLHVHGEVDKNWAPTSRPHELEGLGEGARNLCCFQDRRGHLGDRLRDRGDIDPLELLLVKHGHLGLARDAQDGNGVGPGRVQACDHVGPSRTGGTDAYSDVSRHCARVALRHMGGGLNMPRQDMPYSTVLLHGGVQRIDSGTGDPEGLGGALLLQDLDDCVDCTHVCHDCSSL